jgi:pilus assembly protein CpaB
MILIVIALGCGLVASIGISQVMENRGAEGPLVVPTENIYVATTDIPLGEIMTAKMVKQEEWPKDKVPEGAIRNLEDIEGQRPLTRLYPGEPILRAKLIDANKFYGASEKIPKGYRVASVKVTMDSSASGLINPGDRVDVLVFLRQGRGVSVTGTRTILKNVTVFAVNDRFQRDADDDAEGGTTAKTVSLLVKPTQVERLMLAQELGRIKLSLRRSDDEGEDAAGGATIADLNSGSAAENGGLQMAAAGELSRPSSGGITDFLKGMKALSSATADTSKQAWVMHVHTPNDVQVFNWDNRNDLPRELLSTVPAGTNQYVPSAALNFAEEAGGQSDLDKAKGDSTAEIQAPETDNSASLLD